MRRRLGVFVFFDEEGIADRYVDYLLINLKRVCQEIYLIVNGTIRKNDLERLEQYTTKVYRRENMGYDAGAYKDTFLKFIPYADRERYDEIVLMNDTMFGPVFSLEGLWNNLKKEDADFWGLTRHRRKVLSDGSVMNSHIQTYFLVIGKHMLKSPQFTEFWERLPYPENSRTAIDKFELEFTAYFEARGFRSKALMDNLNLFCEENPYIYYSYELISNNILPFLKKKCLGFERPGYENTLEALEYIEKNFQYDSDMIWENILRLSERGRFESVFNYYELEEFYKKHRRIFIYGAGKYGKSMQKYFRYRKWEFERFLVSDNADREENCSNYADESFEETDGIILALGKKSMWEVLEKINKDLNLEQLFIPQYE